MYRLLKVRCVAINNSYATPLQNNLQTATRVCSFCKFYHPKIPKSTISYLQCRHQTTTINTAMLDLRIPKKIKRKSKQYAELLEVADHTMTNRKATVKKLNVVQLAILMDQPDIGLDNLHMIRSNINEINRKRIQQYDPETANDVFLLQKVGRQNYSDSEKIKLTHESDDDATIIEDLQASGISDQAGLIKNSSFLETLEEDIQKEEMEEETIEIVHKGKAKSVAEKAMTASLAQEKTKQSIEMVKEENFARALLAYLQVCLSSGMTAKAYQTLMHYRRCAVKFRNSPKITDIKLYNLLLRHYASTANIKRITEILEIIKKESIRPTPSTYAGVFEAFGRLNKPATQKEWIEAITLEMNENAITFQDIIKSPKYILDQRRQVMKAIKYLQPNFLPDDNVSDFSYGCDLLKNINHLEPRVDPSPAKDLLTVHDLQERMKEQLKLEIDGDVVIKSIEKAENSKSTVDYCRKKVLELEDTWREIVTKAFDRNLIALKNRERIYMYHSMTLYPYLRVLRKEVYVKALIREIRRLADGSETFSPALFTLYRELGSRINEKFEISEKKRRGVMKKTRQVYMEYCDWYLNRKDSKNSRIAWHTIGSEAEKKGPSLEMESLEWPFHVRVGVGKFLYDIILKDLKLDINCIKPHSKEMHYLPAFYTLFRTKGKRLKEEIKPHPILSKLYRESQPETLTFAASLVPSLCPPKPWNTVRSGGYLVAKSEVIRVPSFACQQWRRLESAPSKQLWPALDSLNQLASIPWRVNDSVLDVVTEVFRGGGSVKLNVPQPPSVLPAVPLLQPDSDESERIKIAKARIEYRQRKGEMYSLWCDLLYRLSLANHFRDKIFWLPHNMDFRGRVYPIPPHLNHLGSDLARSLLVFALGKPLGPGGLDWLKIHTINLTGFMKREPISERLKYANDHLDEILDSAEKPLTGKMWWSTSDEPWQTLAACMEIAKALKSPDHEKYICHFPIHQDGSCNGLQHYAALGRDQIGAENVNLHPFDTPQDVYSSVAAMVNEIRERDAENGSEVAKVLKGFVKRKVIKQTVMTTVYGVTKFGARLQIARQLKDIEDFPQEHVWTASMYLVQKTFESLRTMFESAREIQDWFTECARVISIHCGKNVEWVTPLGLPIVQPYSKEKLISCRDDSTDRPNTMKQKNAFPPNFVHSLDSSHMMLTSLHCEHAGLTFMSVHDCFWTHACTVATMNKICREQFVALHSEPILEDLSRFLLTKYGFGQSDFNDDGSLTEVTKLKLNHTLSQLPTKGTFKLEGVLKSTYFFS